MIKVKRVFVFFVIVFFLFMPFNGLYADNDGRVQKVVIDAGHGGKDPGALGKNSREKDIALSIALKTGAYIEKYLPDVEVIYTRKDDRFVELHKRTQIANDAQADLFISIHCNANRSSQPFGTETYVMGLHKSKANLEVAQKENAAILKEEDYQTEYEGFDPESPVANIIFNMYQKVYRDQSLHFASNMQNQFKERVGLHDRGVMEAGFLVLYRLTMPGVLVETGFLSNSKDEKYLMTEKGQVYIASAIYRAFKEYKIEMEKNLPDIIIPAERPVEEPAETKEEEALAMEDKEKELVVEQVEETKPAIDKRIYFRVQFATSAKEIQDPTTKFKGVPDVDFYEHNSLFKYTSGNFESFNKANKLKNQIRKSGYKDAFVIAMQNNQRIPVKKAKKLAANQ